MPSFDSSHIHDGVAKPNAVESTPAKPLVDTASVSEMKSFVPAPPAKVQAAGESSELHLSSPYNAAGIKAVHAPHAVYNPEHDPLLKDLKKTGHGEMRKTLMSAYDAVKAGDLTMEAYTKYEGVAVNLKNNPSEMGVKSMSDLQTELTALSRTIGGLPLPQQDKLIAIVNKDLNDQMGSGEKPKDTSADKYNPAEDHSLQSLLNFGDEHLKGTLLNAYKAVESGHLSMDAYSQFEGVTLNLKSNPEQVGMKSVSNSFIEGVGLLKIWDGLRDSDRDALYPIVFDDINKPKKHEK